MITRFALRALAAVGVKVRLTVQLPVAPTATPAAQLPPEIANSELPVLSAMMFSGALPVLERIAVCAALVEPTLALPNVSDVVIEATGAAAAVAVPLSAIAFGLPAALCVIDSDPLRAPTAPAPGRNATDTLHEAPPATVPPALQVPPATTKSAALLSVIAEIDKAALPVLLTVMFWAAPVVPIAAEPSANDVVETLATGACATVAVALPLKVIATGDKVLLLAMPSVPVRVPAAVGAKLTRTVQLCPVASVAAQVPPARAKSPVVVTVKLLSA